ncbi:MAG: nucleotidyltransferase domain-containing protein [Candidatus Bipolaricaulota bacterium]
MSTYTGFDLPMVHEEKLAEVFGRQPEVEAVYLFGSTAEGHASSGSDLDLAVLPARGGSVDKLELLADLVEAGFSDVDLVVLDGRDLVLEYEAVRHNRLVYAVPEFDRGETYSRIVRRYLDFLPYLEIQRRAYKRRILDGQA